MLPPSTPTSSPNKKIYISDYKLIFPANVNNLQRITLLLLYLKKITTMVHQTATVPPSQPGTALPPSSHQKLGLEHFPCSWWCQSTVSLLKYFCFTRVGQLNSISLVQPSRLLEKAEDLIPLHLEAWKEKTTTPESKQNTITYLKPASALQPAYKDNSKLIFSRTYYLILSLLTFLILKGLQILDKERVWTILLVFIPLISRFFAPWSSPSATDICMITVWAERRNQTDSCMAAYRFCCCCWWFYCL